MKVYKEIFDLNDFDAWEGGKDTKKIICDADLGQEFITVLEDIFPEGCSATELNDFLWFDYREALSLLGLNDDENKEEE